MPIGLRIRVMAPTISQALVVAPSPLASTIAFPAPVYNTDFAPSPLTLVVSHPGFVRDLGGADVAAGATYYEYSPAKQKMLSGDIDLDTDDIRALLVMTNTTAHTDLTAEFISEITTLDEFDGAGYVRQALASEAVTLDTPNLRAEFDAADEAFAALSNGTRMIAYVLLYKQVTNDNDSVPICLLAFTAFNPGGGVLTLEWNAEGILWLT